MLEKDIAPSKHSMAETSSERDTNRAERQTAAVAELIAVSRASKRTGTPKSEDAVKTEESVPSLKERSTGTDPFFVDLTGDEDDFLGSIRLIAPVTTKKDDSLKATPSASTELLTLMKESGGKETETDESETDPNMGLPTTNKRGPPTGDTHEEESRKRHHIDEPVLDTGSVTNVQKGGELEATPADVPMVDFNLSRTEPDKFNMHEPQKTSHSSNCTGEFDQPRIDMNETILQFLTYRYDSGEFDCSICR